MTTRRALATVLLAGALAAGPLGLACGGDDDGGAAAGDPPAATATAEPSPSPLAEGAAKATIRPDGAVGVVADEDLGQTFYTLTIANDGTEPYVWGDLRETPEIPADAQAFSPGVERDGMFWRYAVAPGLGATITFSTPLG